MCPTFINLHQGKGQCFFPCSFYNQWSVVSRAPSTLPDVLFSTTFLFAVALSSCNSGVQLWSSSHFVTTRIKWPWSSEKLSCLKMGSHELRWSFSDVMWCNNTLTYSVASVCEANQWGCVWVWHHCVCHWGNPQYISVPGEPFSSNTCSQGIMQSTTGRVSLWWWDSSWSWDEELMWASVCCRWCLHCAMEGSCTSLVSGNFLLSMCSGGCNLNSLRLF